MNSQLPPWFRQPLPPAVAWQLLSFFAQEKVNTVCREAHCPNLGECFPKNKFTFLILGEVCSRNCRFCNVKKEAGKLSPPDLDEPFRLAKVTKALGLRYAVITSVSRDDLEDGGAGIFRQSIDSIHKLNTDTKIEVLVPDLNHESLEIVLDASPDVLAHNIETVEDLYPDARPMAKYDSSLEVLKHTKDDYPHILTKSSILLGMGETEEELVGAMQDLREVHCDILILGQYLAPSSLHYPVKKFVTPEEFVKYKEWALESGFKAVLAGPLVRSSYQAEEIYYQVIASRSSNSTLTYKYV